MLSKLYGRGWAFKRVDGERGAKCEMLPANPERINEVLRKLRRIKQWIEYFELDSWIDKIIAWAETDERDKPLVLSTHLERYFFG